MANSKTVLVVDDSPSIRAQVRNVLERSGFSVRQAGNRLGLMNTIEEYGVCADLVIMDLSLKSENGFDLIAVLQENDNYKNIPILILTEHADRVSVLKAKKLGVEGYLRKPIVPEEMIRKLRSILSNEEKKSQPGNGPERRLHET